MADFEAELNALVASSASEARTPHIKVDTMSELTSRKMVFGSREMKDVKNEFCLIVVDRSFLVILMTNSSKPDNQLMCLIVRGWSFLLTPMTNPSKPYNQLFSLIAVV